ncbi:RNase H family protein [Brucella intermedia]|uniref:RNase H family protein n=1 Tax=Brucella intermedia TaxID=94625 RepID=UPI003969C6A0
MTRLITLFVDASHCPSTKAAGWGAWAKQAGWPNGKLFGGQFKGEIHNSAEAELCAIANALQSIKHTGLFEGGVKILVQSDCLRALGLIASSISSCEVNNHPDGCPIQITKAVKPTTLEAKALAAINALVTERQRLGLRHVRGHKAGQGRSWVNRQCDSIAKGHMKQARLKFSTE